MSTVSRSPQAIETLHRFIEIIFSFPFYFSRRTGNESLDTSNASDKSPPGKRKVIVTLPVCAEPIA